MAVQNELDAAIANEALSDDKKLAQMFETLATGPRRERQHVAAAVNIIAKTNPQKLEGYIDNIIDGLNRPEAQTRWELLEAMALLVEVDGRACTKAIPEADAALFDEESGTVRLGAMRFLCSLGATTAARCISTVSAS